MTASDGFIVSPSPVVTRGDDEHIQHLGATVALPRIYGAPILFAIARDPRTIFTYWSVDWPATFGKHPPPDRQVHLRVIDPDGTEQTHATAEPMAGNCYLTVFQSGGPYRVKLGYYHPADIWHSVATSNEIAMPPGGVSEDFDVDLATLPFHLSFQRLIDLFHADDANPLTRAVSELQKRALRTEKGSAPLSAEEKEALRASEVSLEEIESARRSFCALARQPALRKRVEAILGLGATSPAHGFGPSSWSSAGS